uniref:Uncharacterized protein n=1 Tax=Brassica oleracea TaxID=3712 RepID=A0A3P6BAP7_BRAOL|nr:unnamed protein product [Brassica oleracea]
MTRRPMSSLTPEFQDHSLLRSDNHCENLISQNTYLHQLQSFSRSHLVSFLLEQKFCSGYVSTALSKTIIDN